MTDEKEAPPEKEFKFHEYTHDELRAFILDVVDGRVFLLQQVPENQLSLLGMIFMPLGLGGLSDMTEEQTKQIGTIYEYYDKSMSRSINGYPIFASCRIMHKDDWTRACEKIVKIRERRDKERAELEINDET